MDTATGTRPSTSSAGTHNGGELGVSVQEAATSLGVSVNTIRRWIKGGRIPYEKLPTPAGYAYRVYPGRVPSTGTRREVPLMGTPREVPALAPDLQRAEAMASYSRSLLEPLVARLAEQEQIIREQAVDLGRLHAELEYAREPPRPHQTPTAANLTAEAPDPPSESPEPIPAPSPVPQPIPPQPNGGSPWWRRWWAALSVP